MTNQRNKVQGLDLMRAIAIALVMFLHLGAITTLPNFLHKFALFGWSGVDLFFVLSGFLISSQIIFLSSIDFKQVVNFWIKRWTRTIPLYFFFIILYFFIRPIFFHTTNQDKIWHYLLFIQNFYSPKDFVQSWSLCIEEQFYLILPLLFFAFNSIFKKLTPYLILLLLAVISRFIQTQNYSFVGEPMFSYFIRFPSHTNLDGLIFGVVLAMTKNHWQAWPSKHKSILFFLALFLVLAFFYYSGSTPVGYDVIWAPTILAIMSSIVLIRFYDIKISNSLYYVVEKISFYSYGMYLWNNVFAKIIERLPFLVKLNWPIVMIIFFGSTFVASFVTYHLIEKHGMRLRKLIKN